MKKILLMILLGAIICFAACSVGVPDELKGIEANEEFEITLYVEKDRFTADEAIGCYATLEYIGDDDSITVYSGDPLLGFGLKDDTYFDGGYTTNSVLMPTTISKGEVVRYEFTKSGGWSADDPLAEFYEVFYNEEALILPAGVYEISATTDYSLDENDMVGTKRTLTAKATVTVRK